MLLFYLSILKSESDHSEPLPLSSIKPTQPVSLLTPLHTPVSNTMSSEGAEDMFEDLTVYDNKSGLAEVGYIIQTLVIEIK